jgi:hypothetical protein
MNGGRCRNRHVSSVRATKRPTASRNRRSVLSGRHTRSAKCLVRVQRGSIALRRHSIRSPKRCPGQAGCQGQFNSHRRENSCACMTSRELDCAEQGKDRAAETGTSEQGIPQRRGLRASCSKEGACDAQKQSTRPTADKARLVGGLNLPKAQQDVRRGHPDDRQNDAEGRAQHSHSPENKLARCAIVYCRLLSIRYIFHSSQCI